MTSISTAQRFLEKLAEGDLDEIIADGAIGWHNLDDVEGPMSAAPGNFAAVRAAFPDFRYDEVRYTTGDGGVSLARFVIKATLADGSELRAPGCLVITEANGLITRAEEYLDSRQIAPIAAALAAATRS